MRQHSRNDRRTRTPGRSAIVQESEQAGASVNTLEDIFAGDAEALLKSAEAAGKPAPKKTDDGGQ